MDPRPLTVVYGAPGSGRFRRARRILLAQRALYDIDLRLQVMDAYGDYRQILTPLPYLHVDPGLAGRALVDLVRRNNEEMAGIVQQHSDRFAGFAAATPIAEPDAATEEAIHSVRELGALGVQLEEDAVNLPLHESRYDPLFEAMEKLDAGVWLHPCRTPATPGLPRESASFLLWQVFGWTFDTTMTVSQLIFAGIYDRHPKLKLLAHHGGGLIPHFSGRVETMSSLAGMDAKLGEALASLQGAPLEYFRMLYVDTALFGAPHAVKCVIDFFGPERVLFGTDAPFDTQGGSHFIPATISDIEGTVEEEGARAAIFEGNANRVLGLSTAPGF